MDVHAACQLRLRHLANIFRVAEQNKNCKPFERSYNTKEKQLKKSFTTAIFKWNPRNYVSAETWFVMMRYSQTLLLRWSRLLQLENTTSWEFDVWAILWDALVFEQTAAEKMLSSRRWAPKLAPERNVAESWAAARSTALYEKGDKLFLLRLAYVSSNEWNSPPQVISNANKE